MVAEIAVTAGSRELFDDLDGFPPTDAALAARLEAIDPQGYARTRNYLEGRVTRLSPYLTHGYTSVPEVIAAVRARQALPHDHKLVFELAWREYFQHLWSRLAEGIFESRREPPGRGYRPSIPADLRSGATGVPAVDQAVRELYSTGYLHNHARLWLASYAVHLRKVDWRTGADWMYGHLLDGDLASNHLSWQWVAGTLTGRPYLFNAGNVARYAPHWASRGTVIDRGYDELTAIAETGTDVGPERKRPDPFKEPETLAAPPAKLGQASGGLPAGPLMLVHPWSLAPLGAGRIGVIATDFHARFPWSARRWTFVAARLRALCETVLVGSSADLARVLGGREVLATATLNPAYRALLSGSGARLMQPPRFFENPAEPCRSFTQFWQRVQRRIAD